MPEIDEKKVLAVLNQLLESELAGVVRYTHYSFFIFGPSRIPIISWLREQANESLTHAQLVGEWVTTLDGTPSLSIGPLLSSGSHDIGSILLESLETEVAALDLYKQLLVLVEGRHVALEEFSRQMIYTEEMHASGVRKMLHRPDVPKAQTAKRGNGKR